MVGTDTGFRIFSYAESAAGRDDSWVEMCDACRESPELTTLGGIGQSVVALPIILRVFAKKSAPRPTNEGVNATGGG